MLEGVFRADVPVVAVSFVADAAHVIKVDAESSPKRFEDGGELFKRFWSELVQMTL